jgi:hypothetical protein
VLLLLMLLLMLLLLLLLLLVLMLWLIKPYKALLGIVAAVAVAVATPWGMATGL